VAQGSGACQGGFLVQRCHGDYSRLRRQPTGGGVAAPEAVLELSWRNGLLEFAFPYMIQAVKEYTGKVDMLMLERKEQTANQEAAAKEQAAHEAQRNAYQTLMPLALPAPGMGGDQAYHSQAAAFGMPPDYGRPPF
ncbi:clathrin heavy chain, partial [Haematococcus lacustris]